MRYHAGQSIGVRLLRIDWFFGGNLVCDEHIDIPSQDIYSLSDNLEFEFIISQIANDKDGSQTLILSSTFDDMPHSISFKNKDNEYIYAEIGFLSISIPKIGESRIYYIMSVEKQEPRYMNCPVNVFLVN